MSFSLSLKNVAKSFKDYTIYFLTLVFGVAIFYIFNSMDSQQAVIELSGSKQDMLTLMNSTLGYLSVFISFVLGFLIVYANNFLIKRRKKEFGIYMTLGMGKGKISKILLFETIVVGLLSLGVGLLVGILGSQFMSLLVAKMFEANMNEYTFVFSSSALIKTCLYFGIIYLCVMIFNTFVISKCKLINLLNANRKNEKIRVKNPIISIILFILSIISLYFAYKTVLGNVDTLDDEILKAIILGCIGTILFFASLSGFILRLVQTNKRIYLKNLNVFVLRQIHSKINTTIMSMSVICILLFLTICIFSSALSLNNVMKKDLKELTPVDITAYKLRDIKGENANKYSKEEIEDSKLTVKETLENMGYNVDEIFKEYVETNEYATNDYTMKDFLSPVYEEVKKEFPYLLFDSAESLMKVSDYNKIARLYGKEEYTLNSDEYIMLCDYEKMKELRDMAIKSGTKVTINGKEYKSKYDECQDGFIIISSNHTNAGIILLPDEALDGIDIQRSYLNARYSSNTDEEYQEIENSLTDTSGNVEEFYNKTTLNALSKQTIYDASIGLSAVVTFIGLYLGIILLITSAVILALKELSDSSDNKQRYAILRKIGTDEKMINRALLLQIGIFFMMPLFLSIIHSCAGLKLVKMILDTIGNTNIFPSIVVTALFIIVIYGGYFIATYLCSKAIIKEDN